MVSVTRQQLPSIALVLNGLYVGVLGAIPYVRHVLDPPSHEIGFLAEVVFLAFFVVAGGVVAVGVYGLVWERVALPLAVLVGIALVQGTFLVDLYSVSASTQVTVGLGLAVSILPAVGTYLFARRWGRSRD